MNKIITREDLINNVIRRIDNYEYIIYAKKTHPLYEGEPGQFLFWTNPSEGITGINYSCEVTKEFERIHSELTKLIDKANGGEDE